MRLILISILLLSSSARATNLQCQINLNMKPISTSALVMVPEVKIKLGHAQGIDAYVIEKENHLFVVEAFLADYEARIYGEGFIKAPDDKITASIWSRESQIEVTCQQSN